MMCKRVVFMSILCCLIMQDSMEAQWFSLTRFSTMLKFATELSVLHKKKIMLCGTVMAVSALIAKNPSIIKRPLHYIADLFTSLVDDILSVQRTLVVPIELDSGEYVGADTHVLHETLSEEQKNRAYHISASMLAAGAGDALGRVTEFLSMEKIHTDYPKGIHSFYDIRNTFIKKNGKWIAPYTDDTRMAMLVMKELIKIRHWAAHQGARFSQSAIEFMHDHYDQTCHRMMTMIAVSFINDHNDQAWGWAAPFREPGNACLSGITSDRRILRDTFPHGCPRDIKDYPHGWWKLFNDGGGCGSVMHAYPFGLVFSQDPELAARLAAEHSFLSHGAPIARSACASMAAGTACALRNMQPAEVLECMVKTARKYDVAGYKSQTASLIEQAIEWARNPALKSPAEVFDLLRGWSAHEAVAAAAYIFASSPNNLQQAIEMGVHTPGDSDSIASLAGALVGARLGMAHIDASWIEQLEDREQLAAFGTQAVAAESVIGQ